jgi:hypothetical protein
MSFIGEEGQTIQWEKENDKKTKGDLQNTTQKTNYWATLTPQKIGGAPER